MCNQYHIYCCVCVCGYISRCVWLEVIYMVMMSFTSEMHLPQHCQIGLIHIGKAAVCVCVCVFAFWKHSMGLQHLHPVIYQDKLYLQVFVCVCVHSGLFTLC